MHQSPPRSRTPFHSPSARRNAKVLTPLFHVSKPVRRSIRQLNGTPWLINTHVGHEVRDLLSGRAGSERAATRADAESSKWNAGAGDGGEAEHAANLGTSADAVFHGHRRREPAESATKGICIGQQGRAGVRPAQARVVVSIGIEVEHRLCPTRGQAGKLNE